MPPFLGLLKPAGESESSDEEREEREEREAERTRGEEGRVERAEAVRRVGVSVVVMLAASGLETVVDMATAVEGAERERETVASTGRVSLLSLVSTVWNERTTRLGATRY